MAQENLTERFKLPSYTKGKSFAEASKLIQSKFKGREDSTSKSTMEALLGRLKEAQEYLNNKNKPAPTPLQPGQDQFVLGGLLEGEGGVGGPKLDAAMGGVSGAAVGQLGEQIAGALGNTNADVGRTVAGGAQLATGILSGNPMDIATGGFNFVKGGIDALNHKASNAQLKLEKDAAQKGANQLTSDFAKGGNLNTFVDGGTPNLAGGINWDVIKKYSELNNPTINLDPMLPGPTATGQKTEIVPTTVLPKTTTNSSILPSNGAAPRGRATNTNGGKFNIKEGINDLLRSAPTLMTANQLRNLEKPADYQAPKMTDKYKPAQYDEAAGEARVKNLYGNIAESAANATGGSRAALLNALRAGQLAKHTASADEANKAKQFNTEQEAKGQQFNSNINKINLGQLNLQDDINARNLGAFESQKGTLQAALAKSLEGQGTESTNKDRVKNLFDYDWLGEYLQGKA